MKDEDWTIVTDETGRVLGRYYTPQPTMEQEKRFITDLLKSMTKQKTNGKPSRAPETEECVNMCFYAGRLKTDPRVNEFNISALIDVGQQNGSIPVSVYMGKNAEYSGVGKQLQQFRKGDFIKVRCYTRMWSRKNPDGSYGKSEMAAEIVEIRNAPPQRSYRAAGHDEEAAVNEEIPF